MFYCEEDDSEKFLCFLVKSRVHLSAFFIVQVFQMPGAAACQLPPDPKRKIVWEICREAVSYLGTHCHWTMKYRQIKLILKQNLIVSLIFFPCRGEKTNSKTNHYSLVSSLGIMIHCRCPIMNRKNRI